MASRGWGGAALSVKGVRTATNRLRVSLACPSLGEEALQLDLEERSGWLTAGVARPGWLTRLNPEQTATFALSSLRGREPRRSRPVPTLMSSPRCSATSTGSKTTQRAAAAR